ncbi:hypothetical protein [Corynebacterium camporealensis]
MRSAFPLLAAALLLVGCSNPDSEPASSSSSSSETSSSSSATSSSSTSSSAESSVSETQASESIAPAEPVEQAEPAAQPAAEPTLLYCEGGLTTHGMFSDGQMRLTPECDTPEHRRSVRAEGVCGGLGGLETYGQEYIDLCLGGVSPQAPVPEYMTETNVYPEDEPASY